MCEHRLEAEPGHSGHRLLDLGCWRFDELRLYAPFLALAPLPPDLGLRRALVAGCGLVVVWVTPKISVSCSFWLSGMSVLVMSSLMAPFNTRMSAY